MLTLTPIPKRRLGPPRRGRVSHRKFIQWMHETQPCLVAAKGFGGCRGRLTFHHLRKHGAPKDDRKGLILCEAHHLHDFGPDAIERGKEQFEQKFRLSIDVEAQRYWDLYQTVMVG